MALRTAPAPRRGAAPSTRGGRRWPLRSCHDVRARVAAGHEPVGTAPNPAFIDALERTAAHSPADEDPWTDPRWTRYKWTVYRDVAYDLTGFMDRHPAGQFLLNLSIGRDCTALFESYHLRPAVAVARLKTLPTLDNFPVHAVPRSPRPNDSKLYNAIQERVRSELFRTAPGAHRSGSEAAAAAILGYAAVAYAAYAAAPGLLTGVALGLAGAWIGLTVQHCGNHGAMSTSAAVNVAMGLTDDLIGGSSLLWRYHHQVSHHIHCNDETLDEDVFSAFPLLRFDPRLPRHPWHRFQHLYMWATFPLLQLSFQFSDIAGLLQARSPGASLYGASRAERASVLLGKAAHFALLWAVPAALHGLAATWQGAIAYVAVQGVVLASTFAVSHNVTETKPLLQGAEPCGAPADTVLKLPYDTRDWAVQQVLTSANWGGVVGNFFTGGLNLQIEHHLFPAVSFVHYPAISKIVREECEARDIPYASYATLPEILQRFVSYMRDVGVAEQQPIRRGGKESFLNSERMHQSLQRL